MSNNLEKSFNILPEAFYDVLAYIIPSAYLVVGILLGCDSLNKNKILNNASTTSWVIELFVGIIILGGLYCIGTIITSFSFYLIQKPISKFLFAIKRKSRDERGIDKYTFDLFGDEIIKLRIQHPSISTEITKRYARLNLLRNIAFSSLFLLLLNLLGIVGLINFSSKMIVWILLILLASVAGAGIRSVWLRTNLDRISRVLVEKKF